MLIVWAKLTFPITLVLLPNALRHVAAALQHQAAENAVPPLALAMLLKFVMASH